MSDEDANERGEDAMTPLAAYLKVLGNAKRLRILRMLQKPRYVEEIASELKMSRQSALEHVEQLIEIGVAERMRGKRESGSVVDFVVVQSKLFAIWDDLGKLSHLETEFEEGAEERRRRTSPLATGATAPREQDLPRLTIVHGLRIGETTPLTGNGPWLVGREVDATVPLDYDPFVSARHAEVRRAGGGFEVADLYSSNGTFLEWKRLDRGASARIENGAVLRVGKTLLLFRRPA